MKSHSLEPFFRSWEHSIASDNIPAQLSHFAETFMVAGPQGAQPVRLSDFALALPKRKQLFDSLGSQPSSLVSLVETRLDDRYSMARTQWRMTFAKNDAAPHHILVDSTYILDTGIVDPAIVDTRIADAASEEFKIIFYLPHQDILAILKDRGIMPG